MNLLFLQTGHAALRRLVILRSIAILAQLVTLGMVYLTLDMALPWLPLLLTIGGLTLFTLWSYWRLRQARSVGDRELLLQLAGDVLALAILLYFSGGSTNPFVSLFLLPLVITAALLPAAYTWGMALLTTGCYTLLMQFHIPLPQPHTQHESAMHAMEHGEHAMGTMPQESSFNLHVLGMWLSFVLSTLIIAWFVVRMAQAVRDREASLAHAREETLRNERIVALGTLAAGAAHELGTPLSTMAVVIGELRHEPNLTTEWQESLTLLDGQLRQCRRTLDKMLSEAETPIAVTPLTFLNTTIDEWRLVRPRTECTFATSGCESVAARVFDPALRPALLNLLNNAADASPQRIVVHANCQADMLTLLIDDSGGGLSPAAMAHAGTAYFTTKQEGHGLGLLLANATLERLGGSVRLYNRNEGGARTEVKLPLQDMP